MPIFDQLAANLQQIMTNSHFDLTTVQSDLMAFLNTLEQHALADPEPVFAVLRRLRPVFLVKNVALVTLYADVQDVLVQDQVFGVPYGPKMRIVTDGPDFFLGMPNSPAYERDVSHMRSVIRRTDLQNVILPYVSAASEAIVKAANGQLKVVSQLTETGSGSGMISSYYGCPPDSIADLAEWAPTNLSVPIHRSKERSRPRRQRTRRLGPCPRLARSLYRPAKSRSHQGIPPCSIAALPCSRPAFLAWTIPPSATTFSESS